MKRSDAAQALRLAASIAIFAAAAAAQFRFTRTDGTEAAGELGGWTEQGAELRSPDGRQQLASGKILFFHGPAGRLEPAGRMRVDLGRDVHLSGDVLGGDADGETLTLRTAALGTLRVELDRVRLLRVRRQGRLYAATQFAAAPGDGDKESVFRATPLGLDPVNGVLDRVGAKGIWFEWREDEKAELFAWDRIAGLRLPADDAVTAPSGPEVVVLTAGGSRVRGTPQGVEQGRLELRSPQLGDLRIALDKILAGHVVDRATRVFLSSLKPRQVQERDFLAPETLFPWRTDRNVEGGPLSVQRQFWTTGLGCHSLSRLAFEVPPGVKTFACWVGADDSAVGGDKFGDMDFKVSVGGKVVRSRLGAKGGQRAMPLAPLAVRPGDVLILELDFGGEMGILDRGDWVAPVFLR